MRTERRAREKTELHQHRGVHTAAITMEQEEEQNNEEEADITSNVIDLLRMQKNIYQI